MMSGLIPGRHYLSEAYTALLPFLWTGLLLVGISTLATYITAKFVLWWREAVTFHYLTLACGVEVKIEGASQRIQEDIGRFTKVMETISWSVVGSIFTLIGFVPVLWALSTGVQLPLLAAVPGALVWVCLLTSLGGLLISWLVGSKLTDLEYNNQVVEAASGRSWSTARMIRNYIGIRQSSGPCSLHPHQLEPVIPIQCAVRCVEALLSDARVDGAFLVLGAGLFVGLLTFGVMMQVNDAFTRVNNTVSQFIQNWQIITEVRSIYRRWANSNTICRTCSRNRKKATTSRRALTLPRDF